MVSGFSQHNRFECVVSISEFVFATTKFVLSVYKFVKDKNGYKKR